MLKQFVAGIQPVYEALAGAKSVMLKEIRRVSLYAVREHFS
jgi:DNA mismatch repair protein MSH4